MSCAQLQRMMGYIGSMVLLSMHYGIYGAILPLLKCAHNITHFLHKRHLQYVRKLELNSWNL